MSNINLKLPRTLKDQIEQRIASGEYRSPDQYLSDLLRRDQQRRKQRQLGRRLLNRIDRADAVIMDETDFARIRKRAVRRIQGA